MTKKIRIDNNRCIAIYGAGTVADIFYYYLCSKGYKDAIKMFVVSDTSGNIKRKFGLGVYGLDETSGLIEDCQIFIATQIPVQDKIAELLKQRDIFNYTKVNADELVDEFFKELYKYPINDNKILGQNQKVAGYGDNPKYLFEALHKKDQEGKLDLVWAVGETDSFIPEYVRQVEYGSLEYYKELATARIWLDNARKSRFIKKRNGQIYIQTWHGAAPVKKVEADVAESLDDFYIESAKNDSSMADLFLSGSKFYSELYKKSFWYNGEILEAGLPRHDVFWNISKVKRDVYSRYDISENTGTVLYAPTFRKNYVEGCYSLDIDRVLSALALRFDRPFKMLVSRHPTNHHAYEFLSDRYIYIDKYQDFEEILAAADVLITDYSGCMYDFSFSRRPIFLFQTDYDEYIKDRGFYIPMEDLPYISARTNDDLIEKILNYDNDVYVKKLESFMTQMGNFDRGNASEVIADIIFEKYLNNG
ncbi:glycosyl/glycerophosphate transferase, teichoic acid biosynthesis [Lachnospiraceae bacterium JC7]|nr:glycosyl/glycerophosphate transferase, teichoic acid biosynthesis [Lachnospiraceae bacterium JC7]